MQDDLGNSDESFLPQIIGIFYATFHPKQGPIVPYKTPENLISHSEQGAVTENGSSSRRGSVDAHGLRASSRHALEDAKFLGEDPGLMMQRPSIGASPISPKTTQRADSLDQVLEDQLRIVAGDMPSVPEPAHSQLRTSLHTCSTPASAVTSRDQSPSNTSATEVTDDDEEIVKARRLVAFTRDRTRDRRPPTMMHVDEETEDDGLIRGRPVGARDHPRCASESPNGLERIPPHQSHIHPIDINAAIATTDTAQVNPPGISSSLGSHRLESARSRTRRTSVVGRSAASVSPSRLGRWRGSAGGLRSASPASGPGSRIPSLSASSYAPDASLCLAPSPPPALLDFSQISEYIIGKAALKHRLVTCTLGKYRILSFPCVIEDERYPRNQFIWNLAFVFDRRSDLSAFEPVVRKCGRIFRACELDSQYLTHRSTRVNIQNVIDQMFEDLNSYSETSITIDGINYLELKLFPFYPNPAVVEDWHVPVPLIDFNKVKDDNWDITAQRVSEHINGVNHVSRIAELAEADVDCVRLCVQHFLYYQVIMMIDIFQYSNMYTVKPVIQKMSRDSSVSEECGLYVTRPDYQRPSWPVLLELYSALRPGITVHQWAIDNAQAVKGIDIRRFVTFGIIKGFLRRVHRWPIMEDWILAAPPSVSVTGTGQESGMDSMISRISTQGQGQMLDRMRQGQRKPSTSQAQWTSFSDRHSQQGTHKEDTPSQHNTSGLTLRSAKSSDSLSVATSPPTAVNAKTRGGTNKTANRRESMTSGLTSGFMRIPGTGAGGSRPPVRGVTVESRQHNQASHMFTQPSSMAVAPSTSLPSNSNLSSHHGSFAGQEVSTSHVTNASLAPRRPSIASGQVGTGSGNRRYTGPGGANVYGYNNGANGSANAQQGGSGQGANSRRMAGLNNRHSSRFLSSQHHSHVSFHSYQNASLAEQEAQLKEELKPYLDGTHHTDEIQVRFKMGWKMLDNYLRKIAEDAEFASWHHDAKGWASGSNHGADGSESKRKEKAEAAERGDYGKVVIVLR